MKMLLVFCLGFSSLTVLADDAAKKASLEEIKVHSIKNLDERITNLNNAKSCMSSATSFDQLRTCQNTLKQAQASIKGEQKQWRQNFKAEKKAKREAKKAEKAKP